MAKINVLSAIAIIGLFTIGDYLLHYFNILPDIETLPRGYFLNKILVGTLAIYLLYQFSNFNDYIKATIVAVALQLRYIITQDYNNVQMILLHAILVLAAIKVHIYLARHHQNIYPMVVG